MGCLLKLCGYSITILVAISGYLIYKLVEVPPLPEIDHQEYWGPGSSKPDDPKSYNFKINVSENDLQDLSRRLGSTREFTPPLENTKQLYGFNTNTLKNVLEYWRNKYDWKKRETFLNQYPQFKTQIQGLDIHFIHVKPKVKVRTVPLLILHGWPGSIREFYELIPFLTTPREGIDFVFELIIPSLPGYGFSQASSKVGLGDVQIAVVMNNLMKRVGFEKYYIQGGDWGSMVVKHLAVLYPNNILGLHSNMCLSQLPITSLRALFGNLYPPAVVSKDFEHRMYPLSKRMSVLLEESGYFHLQATKPDTVGVSLNESPIGLAAYILEKFSTATDITYKTREDGGLLEKFSYEQLLDNIMIYWVSHSMTTAMRLYAESVTRKQRALSMNEIPIDEKVPCACSKFKNEIVYMPDSFLRDKYTNLIQSTEYTYGGHFIALEEPKVFSEDIFSAIDKMEKLRR